MWTMKIKTTLSVIALTLAPTLALAEGGCMFSKQQSASQCAPGTIWNAQTQTCSALNS
jgi:hypothetical protein